MTSSQTRRTRRDVLKASAAALAAPALVPGRVLGLAGPSAPSETVRVGVIGCGGRARFIRDSAGERHLIVDWTCVHDLERARRCTLFDPFAESYSEWEGPRHLSVSRRRVREMPSRLREAEEILRRALQGRE
jgi:hypothetical protein